MRYLRTIMMSLDHSSVNIFQMNAFRIKKFLLYLASNVFDANLRQYAFDKFEQTNEHKDIKKEALYALSLMYPEDLITSHFLEHEDLEVRKVAIRASAIKVTQEMVRLPFKCHGWDTLRFRPCERIIQNCVRFKNIIDLLTELLSKIQNRTSKIGDF